MKLKGIDGDPHKRWSMCVVAARADRRMEEIRHTHTDTDISRPADTGHVD